MLPSPKGEGCCVASGRPSWPGLAENHEPRREERPRHGLQRLAHPPVQLDLVVQRAEDVGNGESFWEGRN